MTEEKLDGFPSDELIDFVINLKRKITLEKGFCTDADVYLAGLKAKEVENEELKCECRRCVYTDSPCVLSDYGKENGICDHFKDVFDEIAELKEQIEKMKCCGNCKKLKGRFDRNTNINILYCSDSDMKQIEVGFNMCCCKWEIKE